jgi:HK97 family phage major capsid protein
MSTQAPAVINPATEFTEEALRSKVKEWFGEAQADHMKENTELGKRLLEDSNAAIARMKELRARDSYGPVAGKGFYRDDDPRGLAIAGAMRVIARHKGDRGAVQEEMKFLADRPYGEYVKEKVNKALSWQYERTKAIAAGATGSAGNFIEATLSTEVIELLRPAVVVESFGPRMISLPQSGNLTIAKQATGATFTYIGENQGTLASQWTTSNIVLSAKKVTGLVPLSNESLRFSSIDLDRFTRDDLVAGFRVKKDQQQLRGTGTAYGVKGLRYQAAAANVTATNGTTLAQVTADIEDLILSLEENNVPVTKRGWIFAPRSRSYLMTLRGAQDNWAFRPEMLMGTLLGFPWRATTSIPKNLGGGGNESEVIYAEFDDIIAADVHDIEIDVSDVAAFKDESGNIQASFADDQTVIRAIGRHDFQARRAESIAVKTGILWGS